MLRKTSVQLFKGQGDRRLILIFSLFMTIARWSLNITPLFVWQASCFEQVCYLGSGGMSLSFGCLFLILNKLQDIC
jgi:alpha-N-acetylglucosamine transferase